MAQNDGDEQVLAWRRLRLFQMGVPADSIDAVADNRFVDLHAFERAWSATQDVRVSELCAEILVSRP